MQIHKKLPEMWRKLRLEAWLLVRDGLGGPPNPVIVTIRDSKRIILGSSHFPSIPLLQGGGSA